MQRYFIARLLLLAPTMTGITFLVFIAVRLLPGDVIVQLYGESYSSATPDERKQLEEKYKLNQAMPRQYVGWLASIGTGDLGTSITTNRSVGSELKQRLPTTFQLGLMGLIVSVAIALPVGVLSAVRQDTVFDLAARSLAIILLSVPSFWIALLAITYGFIWFGWTPPLRFNDLWNDPIANLQLMWVPALILGTGLSGTVMRLTRSTVLDVLRQDYVRTAHAKGLRERKVVLQHVLRNAFLPVITVIGLQVPLLVGGTVILERIFSIPGMASYLLTSIQQRDYPVVQAVVLISATVVVVSNLLVDMTYALIDPRIRLS